MLQSMTGYGKSILELDNKKISIEIKSLNSKQLDINTSLPSYYRDKDLEIRKHLKTSLERGKIDVRIFCEGQGSEKETKINKAVVSAYFNQLQEISEDLELSLGQENVLPHLLRLPDALKTEQGELDENEWLLVFETFEQAVKQLINFRIQEGNALEEDILQRIQNIENLLEQVKTFENQRVANVKNRIREHISESIDAKNIDQNRLEQEIIYYLEKLDITEEKIRLANHCKYFVENAKNEENNGKMLGFVCQEIGREINTLGSKANDVDIQKLVISMKDELEKIKEQILNVL